MLIYPHYIHIISTWYPHYITVYIYIYICSVILSIGMLYHLISYKPGSRLIFRRESKWHFDDVYAAFKSSQLHWFLLVACVQSLHKVDIFLFCKMRVGYCDLHQILVKCRKKVFAFKFKCPKFFRQAHAWTWCEKKGLGDFVSGSFSNFFLGR